MSSFPEFCQIWVEEIQGLSMPDLHIVCAEWLESYKDPGVLMMPRGHAKSTKLGLYCAWRLAENPAWRLLIQGADDRLTYKVSRHTQSIIRRHPLCAHLLPIRGGVENWWVEGSNDERVASMTCAGILSNATGSRADEIINDDTEVKKNVETPESREKLRGRLSEQTHIVVPIKEGGKRLFVGTPHAHDSIYQERINAGADSLVVRMFSKEKRYTESTSTQTVFPVDFEPEFVFVGIHKFSKLLKPGVDYEYKNGAVNFNAPPCAVVDFYSCAAWPERFDREEMEKRRAECRTLNEWDSQYQLHAKPINQVRLDPSKICAYDAEPRIVYSNRTASLYLGRVKLFGVSCRWDPSSGKINSDVSSVAIVYQDEAGRRYWHRAEALIGEIAEFGADGKTINGGQVHQLCGLIERFALPRIIVETNGVGTHVAAILRACIKQRQLTCAVVEEHTTGNKNTAILEAFEPLISSTMLWAHSSVLCSDDVWDQMQDWNPAVKEQDDDYLDSAAKAITDTPERIKGKAGEISARPEHQDWRPGTAAADIIFER